MSKRKISVGNGTSKRLVKQDIILTTPSGTKRHTRVVDKGSDTVIKGNGRGSKAGLLGNETNGTTKFERDESLRIKVRTRQRKSLSPTARRKLDEK